MERMKRIENLNVRSVRTQGIVRDGGIIRMSTAWFRPAASRPIRRAGSIHVPRFFLPVKSAQQSLPRQVHRRAEACCSGQQASVPRSIASLAQPAKRFATFLRQLFRQDWVVYAKPPFGGPEHVLQYLARYTHRVAISNHRLVSFDGERSRSAGKIMRMATNSGQMTVTAEEFLRRFLLHVLPRGFVRIRFFGFLANRRRRALLPLCRQLLAVHRLLPSATQTASAPTSSCAWLCPHCGGEMALIMKLTAQQIRWRSVGLESFPDTS